MQRSKSAAEKLLQQIHCQRKETSLGSSKELVSIFYKLSLSKVFLLNIGGSSEDLQNKSEFSKRKEK